MSKRAREIVDSSRASVLVAIITGITTIIVVLFAFPPFQRLFEPSLSSTITSTPSPLITYTTIPTKETTTPGSGNSNVNPEIQQLKTNITQLQNSNAQTTMKIDELGTRLEAIESIILEDPAKVLQTTFLINEVSSLKAETQRMYNLFLGMLGLIFTLAISIFTLAIGYRRQRASQVSDSEKTDQVSQTSNQLESLMKMLLLEKTENNELRNLVKQLSEQIESLNKQIKSGYGQAPTKPE